ncbi:C2CD3-like protein [Mya arenaria]|uniref:C2CD3-like protein n=1 Tax=Mya arenaria TaxID=6604 RepID=A0ABY7DTI3_MYAAR|nr:C2CD3-like protein [Mya arenaria]
MKSLRKKQRTPKKTKPPVETAQNDDVSVETGLPPQVEGQLRCFCRVSVTQITWNVLNAPKSAQVLLKWWGEPGNGILFRPVDHNQRNAGHPRTTARFPVRSGPKQFNAYLADMSSLVLEVQSGPKQVPVGTVEVPHLSQLAPNRPINGLFPIISPTEDRIGELHVSMMIESLMASYDSTGSIPTTDLSMETHVTQESSVPKQSRPVPHSDQPRKPNAETRLANGYTEDLRQHLQYEPDPVERQYRQMENGGAVAITTNGDVIRTNYSNENIQGKKENVAPTSTTQATNSDLLSVLLDKGNKLREQMIVSSLHNNSRGNNSVTERVVTHDVPHGVPQRKPVDVSGKSMDGSFLQEILRAERLFGAEGEQLDDAAVDLVFGGQLTDDIRLFKGPHGSPNGSISGDDDMMSDYEDPVHSQSLLQELFYKNNISDENLSDISCDEYRTKKHKDLEDESNMRPPSRSSSMSSLALAFPPEPETKKHKPRTPKRKSRTKVRRKGSKKRKGSRSRSGASASEFSDSDVGSRASTPRSESSRVSFDMVPSDIDEPPTRDEPSRHKKSNTVDGMSVERLTLLGRVHVARVTIDSLQLAANMDTSSSKSKPKTKYGIKPPKPSPKAKNTYFIEYQFPVVATSRDKYSPNAMATEVMRVVSRNVKNGVVTFNHRSVFPVMFDGTAVERWWKSALVFKLYSRNAGQKVPALIGSCGIPLKSILKSESLYVGKDMEVRNTDKSTANTSANTSRHGNHDTLGSLRLVIELASDSKEFPTQLARTKLAELTGKAKIVPIAQAPTPAHASAPKPPPAPVQQRSTSGERFNSAPRGTEGRNVSRSPARNSRSPARHAPRPAPVAPCEGLSIPAPVSVQHYDGDQAVIHYHHPLQEQQQGEVMTLHALLLIPDGRNITMQGVPSLAAAKRHPVFQQPSTHSAPGVRARDMVVRNCYLVCRMFWCDEAVHSAVFWGTSQPQFNFQQIAPVLMSQSLLERMKNNFMIVEVWDKKTSADNDKLVGMVKLSLHQFYMSFRDKRMSTALLKSQYPVIAVENYLPVVDVFSGSQYGQINVLLAMGSAEQIAHLVRMKTEGLPATSGPERPQHYLERKDLLHQGETVPAQIGTEAVVEHIFEIVIEGLRGLEMEGMIWGEADCFVQYHFPTQAQTTPPGSPVIRHAVPTMKAFRTATTLCVADPTFHDVTRHRILLPQATPVQRELLTACGSTGSGSGGLPFELWCRYYHPNVRDQCSAKGTLPLAKLCAMVTMQKRGEPSVQTFSFPLQQVGGERPGSDRQNAGLIDVTIHYKNQLLQSETAAAAANKNLTGAQAAAEVSAQHDQGMQYPAEVGVNAYLRVKLSFLGAEGERTTRTVARSFAPEFSHFMDFPCPLLWPEPDSDSLCLAEMLESAEATFEVWHQVPGMSAGINGWFPVNVPVSAWSQGGAENQGEEVRPGTSGLARVGGGLEINVKFAHHEDRERVVHAARGVGWSPVDLDIEQDDWESEDESSNRYHHINITVDQVTFPLQSALIAGQNTLDKTAQCYIRYKFYDKAAVMSRFCPVSVTADGYITAKPKNKHDLQIPDSSMYLREEHLEVQVWVTYGAHQGEEQRPRHRDKLIGTSYVAMETLGDQRRKQHRVSGLFPMYKPGACNLGGGFLRAHITTKPQFGKTPQSEHQEGLITLEGEDIDADYDPDDSFHQIVSHKPTAKTESSPEVEEGMVGESSQEGDTTPTFIAVVQVERALHLPHMHDKQKSEDYLPNSYVSYPTAESTIPSYTNVFHSADNPVWDHEQETKLHAEMLTQENKHLVFKVWHKPDGAPKSPDKLTDRVLGFVSVDLTPLASGMQQISGWYNIMDFNGHVKGQIKINIIPQESVISGMPGGTGAVSAEPVSSSFLSLPPWGTGAPPLSAPGPLSLPHFQNHYDQVKEHHEHLQQQLQEHIQQFLRQQDESAGQGQEYRSPDLPRSSGGPPVSSMRLSEMPGGSAMLQEPSDLQREPSLYQREQSIHWRPQFPDMRPDDNPSRSFLYTNLRKQMQDLDDITYKLRTKLTCQPTSSAPGQVLDFDLPVTTQSGQYPLTSTQSDFTGFDLPRSQRDTPRDDLGNTGSHGAESSRTVGDSGQYSVEQSGEKYDDSAPVSQRSASDRLDTLRSGVTPRDFLDSGLPNTNNNSNTEEPEQNVWLTISPRESNEKKDEYSESGGFSYRRSPRETTHTPREKVTTPRDFENMLNANMAETVQHHIDNAKKLLNEVKEENKANDQKQMSVIQEFSENDHSDRSDDEGDNRYYHRYRDLLDNEQDESDKEEANEEEEEEEDEEDDEEGEIVVPRRINDVSGKFSPTGEIIMLSEDLSSSVPYGHGSMKGPAQRFGAQIDRKSEPVSLPNTPRNSESTGTGGECPEEILQDVEYDQDDEDTSLREKSNVHMEEKDEIQFNEKDSWLSDSDKEEDHHVVVDSRYVHNQANLLKHKQQRQDSDTGYSSRDNVSESYLTPSAAGTNSETDISRLQEHEHWSDQRESVDDHVFIERHKNRLLANVELESTGGSFGMRYDPGPSRISSAGSRQTRQSSEPSVTESFDEKEEQDYLKQNLEPIESERENLQPMSARTQEIEDFFCGDSQKEATDNVYKSRSDSDCSHDTFNDFEQKANSSGRLSNRSQGKGANSGGSSRELTPRDTTKGAVPNFFMPVQDLEESLKKLKAVTNKVDQGQEREKAAARSEMAAKLTSKEKFAHQNTKPRLPTAEETKRIAKIFSSKYKLDRCFFVIKTDVFPYGCLTQFQDMTLGNKKKICMENQRTLETEIGGQNKKYLLLLTLSSE